MITGASHEMCEQYYNLLIKKKIKCCKAWLLEICYLLVACKIKRFIYATYNSKKAIIKANNPVASEKANPSIA